MRGPRAQASDFESPSRGPEPYLYRDFLRSVGSPVKSDFAYILSFNSKCHHLLPAQRVLSVPAVSSTRTTLPSSNSPLIGTLFYPPKLRLLRNRHYPSCHHQQSIRLMRRGCLIPCLDPVTRVNADHASLTLLPPVMTCRMATLNLLLPHHHSQSQNIPKRRKRRRKLSMVHSLLHFFSGTNCDHRCLDNETDANGMHADINVQNIEDSDDDGTPLTLNKTCPTADVEEFFAPAPKSATVPGDKKKRLRCKTCA